eukprot:TRINITY_DN2799_c0_g1_i11.p1 TRINITY_DN2799_c0_g1~~TRINITY_DN2799_c0_g1_i11.p1  ORF type:complete len:195 (+),score=-18.32 TRINITY_DN2799_c0_g1_i11:932-1516(+)
MQKIIHNDSQIQHFELFHHYKLLHKNTLNINTENQKHYPNILLLAKKSQELLLIKGSKLEKIFESLQLKPRIQILQTLKCDICYILCVLFTCIKQCVFCSLCQAQYRDYIYSLYACACKQVIDLMQALSISILQLINHPKILIKQQHIITIIFMKMQTKIMFDKKDHNETKLGSFERFNFTCVTKFASNQIHVN